MIVDGRTAYSCSMLAIEAQGKDIRTVEGLTTTAPCCIRCSRRSCEHDGTMCGFCTPGFVMSAVALLEKHPEPDTGAGARRARRQHLPLRHLHARARSRAGSEEGGGPWLTRSRKSRRPRARSSMRSIRGRSRKTPPSSAQRLTRVDGAAEGDGPREVHLRHQPARDAARHASCDRRTRTRASCRSISPPRRRRRA